MTGRNLNQTWRDVVFKQYAADHDADVPYPVRYLIYAQQWRRDIFIAVPNKIDLSTYRRAIFNFCKARRLSEDPTYQDDHISVRPRKPVNEPDPPPTAEAEEASENGNSSFDSSAAPVSGH